jgi:hypothetical protein
MQIASAGQRESPSTPSNRMDTPASATLAVWPAGIATWRSSGPEGAVALLHAAVPMAQTSAHTSFMDLF